MDLISVAQTLKSDLAGLRFAPPVAHVYNPLDYAWHNYRTYLERFGGGPREVVLLGMNPGPWGMMQTGVPFGDPRSVRDWMGINGKVSIPLIQHPERPVLGLRSARGEISGQRLWGWAKETFNTPEAFFARFMVLNYCPLCFLEDNGRNRTPDKLSLAERDVLFKTCDRALVRSVAWLSPRCVVGIGRFAAERAGHALGKLVIGMAPHPSPANPNANRGWATQMTQALTALGVRVN
jgi:single-strand selective monofunctional uracil DNA glycosylase